MDVATTSLRDVVERIHADPMLHCQTARVGTRLLTYEDDVTGDPIDMFNPSVALEPLVNIFPHLLPRAAADGSTEFAEGQELWLVVGGCASEAEATCHIGSELLFSRFDAIDRKRESAAIRTLLETIAAVNVRASPQAAMSAIEDACKGRRLDVARCLICLTHGAYCTGGELLHAAAARGHAKSVVLLVREFKADLGATDSEGRSPLHIAAEHGHADVVRVLAKELGADVNAKTLKGWTPLHCAARQGRADAARVLITELNADVDATTFNGFTTLLIAAEHGHADLVRVLAKAKANVSAKDSVGCTPLHTAAEHGHADVVRVLAKELNADVNSLSNDSWTPLHYAALGGHTDTARALVGVWCECGCQEPPRLHTSLHRRTAWPH